MSKFLNVMIFGLDPDSINEMIKFDAEWSRLSPSNVSDSFFSDFPRNLMTCFSVKLQICKIC